MAIQIAGQKAAEKYFNMTLYKVEDVSKVSSDGLSSARFADKSFCYVDEELCPITTERFNKVEEKMKHGVGIVVCKDNTYNMLRKNGMLVFATGYDSIERVKDKKDVVRLTKKVVNGINIYNFASIETGEEIFNEWFERISSFDSEGKARAVTARGKVCTITTSGIVEMD